MCVCACVCVCVCVCVCMCVLLVSTCVCVCVCACVYYYIEDIVSTSSVFLPSSSPVCSIIFLSSSSCSAYLPAAEALSLLSCSKSTLLTSSWGGVMAIHHDKR